DLTRQRDQDRTRFEDTEVSLKWVAHDGVLQDEGTTPSFAVELSASMPTLRHQDRPGGALTGILSGRSLGFTYHLNAGALVEPGGAEPGIAWGVIAEHDLAGPFRAVAEVNGESVRENAADNSVLVGTVCSITAPDPIHALSLDVGVRRGISRAAD